MKNTCVLFVCILALATAVSCSGESSSSSSSAFKIQPGDVTTLTPNLKEKGTEFNVTFGSKNYSVTSDTSDAYAIIISNVNSTGNVGIAFGEDPKSNRSFKVFIYFPSSFPPTSTQTTYSGTVTVIENGEKYTGTFNNVNFTFIGPDSNNCYTINIGVINVVDSKTLQLNSLKAYLVQ